MLFKDDEITKHTVQRLYNKFCSDDESLKFVSWLEIPTVLKDDELKNPIKKYSSQLCQEFANKFRASYETNHNQFLKLKKT